MDFENKGKQRITSIINKQQTNDVKNQELRETKQDYQSFIWDYSFNPPIPIKTNYFIKFSQCNYLNYILHDGSKIRIEEQQMQKNFFQNLEQIQNLQWSGKYGQDHKKIGQWRVVWKGETLNQVGGVYSDNGFKLGIWKEINQNYWGQAQFYEEGEYVSDQKRGKWKYIFENKELGGGSFNNFGQKQGKWLEFDDKFWNCSQIIYQGEYENGIKVGKWDIYQRDYKIMNIIGMGLYIKQKENEEYKEIKNGKWIEPSVGFQNQSNVIYNGRYKNGSKVGQWDIYFKQFYSTPYNLIGGGQYEQDENSESFKTGQWIELSEGFKNQNQVTYNGEYKRGRKIGKWDINFKEYCTEKYKLIGGGQYQVETSGREIKIGQWIELDDRFANDCQAVHIGEYIDNKKVGKWVIDYKRSGYFLKNEQIGGGMYDNKLGVKFGKWTEMCDGFNNKMEILFQGEYNNNKKFGRWQTIWRLENKQQQIGGGCYDDNQGDIGMKIGKWIELSRTFSIHNQVTYNGEYNVGQKVGTWNSCYRGSKIFEKIGGGDYDVKLGTKIGIWIELSDEFNYQGQIIYKGEYKNGIKVGLWYQLTRQQKCLEFVINGEKNYDF